MLNKIVRETLDFASEVKNSNVDDYTFGVLEEIEWELDELFEESEFYPNKNEEQVEDLTA